MRKITYSAFAMLLIVASCSKQTILPYEDSPLVGQWEGVKLVQQVNATVNYCDSYSISFTFNPDGTGTYYSLDINWRLELADSDHPDRVTITIKNNPLFTATIQTNEANLQEWLIMESSPVYDLIKTSFHLTKIGTPVPDVPHGG